MGNKHGKDKGAALQVPVFRAEDWESWPDAKGVALPDKLQVKKNGDGVLVVRKATNVPMEVLKERMSDLMEIGGHAGLAKIVGLLEGNENLFILTEYVEGDSLQKILEEKKHHFTWGEALHHAESIARVMEFFHKEGAIHRNLKPSNIIVLPRVEGTSIKVTDFNSARTTEEDKKAVHMTKLKTKNEYVPPEVLEAKPYGPEVDVYAFGIILWNLVTGSLAAYPGASQVAVLRNVMKGERPKVPDYVPKDLATLFPRLWCKDPKDRATFTDVFVALDVIRKGFSDPELNSPIPYH